MIVLASTVVGGCNSKLKYILNNIIVYQPTTYGNIIKNHLGNIMGIILSGIY